MVSRSGRLHALVLMGFLLIYIIPIGFRPLIIPDETRYAEIPREMIATGDWIVPHLNGLRYFEKPVMGYWLDALAMLAFGENPFAARFPSAMAAGLAALMVWLLIRRSAGNPNSGVMAALIFLTTFEVAGIGVFNVLDSMLAMFITMAMATFYWASQAPPGTRKEKGLLALFGMFCGMAFMTKGFLAFAVPVVTIVPYMLWSGRWKDLFRMAAIPIAAALLVSLPWAVAIHAREPDFWNYFFWEEHVRRFLAEDAQHQAPFWTYLLAFPVAALPWSPMLPAALVGLDRSQRRSTLFRYALCWFVFPLLFFSAARGKLITYILPCFPPFAILLTLGLASYFEKPHRKLFQAGEVLLAGLFTVLLVGLVVIQATDIGGLAPNKTWCKTLWLAAILIVLVGALITSLVKKQLLDKVLLIGLGTAFLLAAAQLGLPDKIIDHKSPGALLLRNASRVQPDTQLVSLSHIVKAACWYYKRDNIFVTQSGELAYGLSYPEARRRVLGLKQLRALMNAHKGKVVLVGTYEKYQLWKVHLPPPIYEDHTGPGGFVFAQY